MFKGSCASGPVAPFSIFVRPLIPPSSPSPTPLAVQSSCTGLPDGNQLLLTASGGIYTVACMSGWTKVFQFGTGSNPAVMTQAAIAPEHLGDSHPSMLSKLSDSDINAINPSAGLWWVRCASPSGQYYVDQYVKNSANWWNSLSSDGSGWRWNIDSQKSGAWECGYRSGGYTFSDYYCHGSTHMNWGNDGSSAC